MARRNGSAILHGATSRSSGRCDLADNQVKAFIVETRPHPDSRSKKSRKIALKVRAERLDHYGELPRPGENACKPINSFRDTARVLKMTRFHGRLGGDRMRHGRLRKMPVKYCQERLQFGKPTAHSRWCRTS